LQSVQQSCVHPEQLLDVIDFVAPDEHFVTALNDDMSFLTSSDSQCEQVMGLS